MANDSLNDNPNRVVFHYLKSPVFRTIHADGVFGGVTPHKLIQINFWNERHPIPQLIEHEIDEDGILGDEIMESRISKKGFVREVDVGVLLDLPTAIAFRDWLNDKITTLEKALNNKSKK